MAAGLASAEVTLRGLSKRFDDVVAVDSVDLHVSEGEFLSLLGPSGCGKTTTLRLIDGFEQPDEGSLKGRASYDLGAGPDQHVPPGDAADRERHRGDDPGADAGGGGDRVCRAAPDGAGRAGDGVTGNVSPGGSWAPALTAVVKEVGFRQ